MPVPSLLLKGPAPKPYFRPFFLIFQSPLGELIKIYCPPLKREGGVGVQIMEDIYIWFKVG